MGLNQLRVKSWCKRTYTRRAHAPLPFGPEFPGSGPSRAPQSSRHLIDKLFCFQYFTSKLLQIRWLVKTWCERKFSLESRKILLSNNLAGGVSHQASQILEPLRLTRKILRRNDLASTRRRRPSPLGIRMMGYFGSGAQGQMSQRRRCRLWKSAGWPACRGFPMLMIFRESDGDLSAKVPARSPGVFCPPDRAFGRAELFSVFFLARPSKGPLSHCDAGGRFSGLSHKTRDVGHSARTRRTFARVRLTLGFLTETINNSGQRLPTNSSFGAPGERSARTSRIGGWPKKRLYSRLNWVALS